MKEQLQKAGFIPDANTFEEFQAKGNKPAYILHDGTITDDFLSFKDGERLMGYTRNNHPSSWDVELLTGEIIRLPKTYFHKVTTNHSNLYITKRAEL